MSKGLLAPGLMGIIALVLPFWCKEWMNKAYLFSLFIALFSAVPWFFVWPYALYQQAPHLFREWFWVQNFGRFFGYAHQGPPNEPGYYLMHLPYFAWPAVPLALLAFWRHWRSGGGIPLRTFPFTAFIVMLGILSLASDARVLYALPMLLPLTLLAVPGVQALTPATIRIANQCNAYCFGFMALVLWLGWLVLQSGYPPFIMEKLHAESPAHISALHPVYLTAAFLITLLWLVVITSYKKSGEGVVFRWTTGVTLLWTLMMTLWLPFVDDARSYRAMVLDLKKALPSSSERIAGKHLGESERAMLEYFGGIRTEKVGDIQSAKNNCNLLLIGTCRGTANNDIGSDWKKIWEGNRPGHKKELFVLFQQVAAQGNSGRTAQHQAYDGAIQAALPGMELHHH
jgi:4-amino-4-deoxy-L-arabinose transferase-like glycosyltransferase